MEPPFWEPQVQVSIDCADPDRLAAFWAQVLGYRVQDPPGGHPSWAALSAVTGGPTEAWTALVDPAGRRPRLLFHRVPEGKVVKNRLHLDIRISGPRDLPLEVTRPRVDAAVERLVALGATHVRTNTDESDYFAVLLDPEGNEFCVN